MTASAILTTTIAALVMIVTCGQWITNRARLRHELFELRYGIFEQIAAFVAGVLQTGQIDHGSSAEFLRRTKRAYFAFGCDPGVKGLLGEIYNNANRLMLLQQKQQILSGDALNSNLDKQLEAQQWFDRALRELEPTFEKFLRLADDAWPRFNVR